MKRAPDHPELNSFILTEIFLRLFYYIIFSLRHHVLLSLLCQSNVYNLQFIEIHWCNVLSDVQSSMPEPEHLNDCLQFCPFGHNCPLRKITKSTDHMCFNAVTVTPSLMSHHILEIIESSLPSLIQSQALWQKPASPSSALLFMVSHSESLTWQMNVVWCSNIAPNGFYALSSISLLFYLSHELSIASSSDREHALWLYSIMCHDSLTNKSGH